MARYIASFALALLLIPLAQVRSSDDSRRIDAEFLNKTSRIFNQIAAHATPSVVSISSIREAPAEESALLRAQGEDPFLVGLGSGVIIRPNGIILTNNHVVEGVTHVTVHFDEKTKAAAHVIGTDPKTDLAVIQLDKPMNLPTLSFANSDAVKIGDWAVAVGSPFGLNHTVTMGTISAKGRAQMRILDIEDFLQTDAAINPGSSGGPLLNSTGEVVGINTAIFSQSGSFAGIGFAIPSKIAQQVAEEIIDHGHVVRGWMGLMAQDLDPDLAHFFHSPREDGALVTQVLPHGPAAEASLAQGDIIDSFDHHPVKSSSELRDVVAHAKVGAVVPIEVLHTGKSRIVSLTVMEQPRPKVLPPKQLAGEMGLPPKAAEIGMSVQDTPMQIVKILDLEPSNRGALVTRVVPGSPAFEAGIIPGDVILQANEIDVKHAKDLGPILDASKEKKQASVLYVQRSQTEKLFLAIRFTHA